MERGRRDRLGPTRPRPRDAPVASAVTVIRSAIPTDAVQYPYAVTVEPGARLSVLAGVCPSGR